MAEDFFRRFDEEMQRRYPAATAADAALPPLEATAATPSRRMPVWVWAAFAVVVVLALLMLVH